MHLFSWMIQSILGGWGDGGSRLCLWQWESGDACLQPERSGSMERGILLFLLCFLSIQSKTPVHGMFLPTFSEDLHFSVNPLHKYPRGHASANNHAPLIIELFLNPIKLKVQANSPLEWCYLKKIWLLCLGQAVLLGIGRQGTGRMGVIYGTPWEREV